MVTPPESDQVTHPFSVVKQAAKVGTVAGMNFSSFSFISPVKFFNASVYTLSRSLYLQHLFVS